MGVINFLLTYFAIDYFCDSWQIKNTVLYIKYNFYYIKLQFVKQIYF